MIGNKFILVVPYTGVLMDFRVAILARKVRYDETKGCLHLHEALIPQRETSYNLISKQTSGLLAIFVTNVIFYMNFYNKYYSICYYR